MFPNSRLAGIPPELLPPELRPKQYSDSDIVRDGVSSPEAKRQAADRLLADGNRGGRSGDVLNAAERIRQGMTGNAGLDQNYGVGGGVSTPTVDPVAQARARAQAEADQLIRGMGQFDTVRGNQDAQAQADYDKAIAGFNDQDARDLGRYNEQVGQNEANLSRQRQQALLASAQGQRGLNAVLASLGALGGTGSVLANRAVAQSANQDLGNAQDTFSTNATNLTQSWQDAKQRQDQRQEDASAQLQALKQNNANTALTGKQNLFRDIANLFDQGSDQRTNYLRQAADLGSQIAATTAPVNSRFMKADPTFSPEALKNYLAGTSDMTVNTSAGGSGGSNVPINSPLFASTDRRRERQLA